jgi:threonine dehydratase
MTVAEPDIEVRPPSVETVRETLARITPHIVRTPIHCWRGAEVQGRVGRETEVILKLELFQHTGTFKPRGALNTMLGLEPGALAKGVAAVSAGNHAIATAYAAKALGVSAKVVMVATANPARIARAKAYGAEVLSAPTGAEAFALARKIADDEGRAFIHPFEGPAVAAGTGTIALELDEQVGPLEALIVPVGGGGLPAGISSVMKALQPQCRIYGVEPKGADSMSRSFAAGKPVEAAPVATIADSLAPPYSLPYSFAVCRDHIDRLVTVDDDQLMEAMAVLFREMKLAVEPAGAATTAALFGPLNEELRGKRVALIICGANIDIENFARLVARGNELAGKV